VPQELKANRSQTSSNPLDHAKDSSNQFEAFDPLECKDWDTLIQRFKQATFFHSSAWLQVLNETYGFKPIAFAAPNLKAPTSIIVLMEVKSWLTGKRGVSLPFSDNCPPLYSDIKDCSDLYPNVIQYANDRKWKYLEIRDTHRELNNDQHSLSYFTHTLNIQKDQNNLFEELTSSNRRAIRKAEKAGIKITRSNRLEDLKTFHDLLCLTRKRHGLPPQPWKFFRNLFKETISKGNGILFLGETDSKPIAGALFLIFNKTATYKFGASDKRFQDTRANNLVMWEAIKTLRLNGFERLDFGRTSHSNKGLRKFKQQWNPDESMITYDRLNLSTLRIDKESDNTQGWFNCIFRSLPTPISKAAGNILYRHVA